MVQKVTRINFRLTLWEEALKAERRCSIRDSDWRIAGSRVENCVRGSSPVVSVVVRGGCTTCWAVTVGMDGWLVDIATREIPGKTEQI